MAALGQLIKETREIRGLEAQALAQRVGVSKGTISNLERGVIKTTPEATMLRSLSDALGLPVSKMLETLGYLDRDEAATESEAVSAIRAILEGRDFTDKQVQQLASMMRSAVEMMEG